MSTRISLILVCALTLSACKDDVTVTDSEDETVVDADGDGYTAADDCDDEDANINPGAEEVCDGIDNNCDVVVDEGAADAATWYLDADGDGYGDEAQELTSCETPEGYVGQAGDCDDTSVDYNPGAAEDDCADPNDYNCDGSVGYADNDGDGFAACEECDDADAAIHPDAAEVCDEVDNDCDGAVDDADEGLDASTGELFYADSDGDGEGDVDVSAWACEAPSGYVADNVDCDDGDAAINSSAAEVCDSVDNDCDGLIDDADDSLDASSGSVYYADVDGDGEGAAGAGFEACEQPSGYVSNLSDCDDTDAAVNTGAAEICDNVDNDCDGATDDDDGSLDASTGSTYYADVDGDGEGDAGASLDACGQPAGYVSDTSDCDDSDAAINTSASEVCDSVDNDCDGDIDDDDASLDASTGSTFYADIDGDGEGAAGAGLEACEEPSGYVSNLSDCDDSDAAINTSASEVCDSVDNDCDGLIDDADGSLDTSTGSTFYADIDGDGEGDAGAAFDACLVPSGYVSDASDCDDTDPSINTSAAEVCDGVDHDCDGDTDDPEELLGYDAACPGFSCLDIIDTLASAPGDGFYYIDPNADGVATEVYCDMSTDGGGYTFLKVDYGSAAYATDAEAYCAAEGMQLFVPRTEDHKDAALDVALDGGVGPGPSVYYMRILGIYPDARGANCVNVAFNSGSCTSWGPDDGGPYFVGTTTSITEPNYDSDTTASMYYDWNTTTYEISWYNDIYSPGYTSQLFMCDEGDKWGDGVER